MNDNDLSYSVPGYRRPPRRGALVRGVILVLVVVVALLLGGVCGWILHANAAVPPISITTTLSTSTAPSASRNTAVARPTSATVAVPTP